jgi:hypothetical protein
MKAEVYLEDDPGFRFALLDGLTIGREGDINVASSFQGYTRLSSRKAEPGT